jgi:hypothetical protein
MIPEENNIYYMYAYDGKATFSITSNLQEPSSQVNPEYHEYILGSLSLLQNGDRYTRYQSRTVQVRYENGNFYPGPGHPLPFDKIPLSIDSKGNVVSFSSKKSKDTSRKHRVKNRSSTSFDFVPYDPNENVHIEEVTNMNEEENTLVPITLGSYENSSNKNILYDLFPNIRMGSFNVGDTYVKSLSQGSSHGPSDSQSLKFIFSPTSANYIDSIVPHSIPPKLNGVYFPYILSSSSSVYQLTRIGIKGDKRIRYRIGDLNNSDPVSLLVNEFGLIDIGLGEREYLAIDPDSREIISSRLPSFQMNEKEKNRYPKPISYSFFPGTSTTITSLNCYLSINDDNVLIASSNSSVESFYLSFSSHKLRLSH